MKENNGNEFGNVLKIGKLKQKLIEEEPENNKSIPERNDNQKININKSKTLIEKEITSSSESEEDNNIKKKPLLSNNINKYIVLYNFSDFLLMLGLFLVPSFCFSYLYYPFILSGVFYSIIVYKNTTKLKKIKCFFTIIVFIYSLLIQIFQIVVIIFHSVFENDIIKNNKILFLDLGVPYLLNENISNFLKSQFGPALMIIICIVTFILKIKCKFQEKDLEKKKKKDFKYLDDFYAIVRRYLFISFLIISAFATFNKSVLTILYLLIFYIIFTIFLISSGKIVYVLYKIYLLLEIILIACHLLILNVINTYSIEKKIIDSSFYHLLSNRFGQMGLYLVNYEQDDNYKFFIDWAGYFFGCLSLVSFIFILKDIPGDIFEKLQKKKKKRKKSEKIINYDKSFLRKLFENIINFFSGELILLYLLRILAIIWIYYIRSFFSILIIIWLFLSFLFLNPKPIRFLSKFLLLPTIFIFITCIASSRIFFSYFENLDNEKKIKYFHFALGNYDYDYLNFYVINIIYMIIIYFISLKPEYENNEAKKNKNNDNIVNINQEDKSNKLTFVNLIKKFIYKHIDKVTLVVMYFIANKKINLFHFILVIIFMIQLIKPTIIERILKYIIILFQILLLVEYIMDLLKVYFMDYFEKNLKLIKLFFTYDVNTKDSSSLFDTQIEIFIYWAIYFFYIHYQLYNYEHYKKIYRDKDITLVNYIEFNVKNQKIKEILYNIGNILKEVYIWIIIYSFIFCACYFEVNIIFAVELLFFFICIYQYCIFIQQNRYNEKNDYIEFNLLFPKLVLIISAFHTIWVYLYQIMNLEYIGLKEILMDDNFFFKNMPNFGFTIYEYHNIYYCLLPHYSTNFLSFLYLTRIQDIFKEKTENENNKISIKDEEKNNIMQKNENENSKLDKNKEKNGTNEIYEEIIETEKKVEQNESMEELRSKAYDLYNNNKKKIKSLEMKYLILKIIMTFTKIYWLFLFVTTGIIYISKDLSGSILIYIIIFGISFICIFQSIIKNLSNFMKKETYFLSKIIRYQVIEIETHFHRHKYYRDISFPHLLRYSLFLLFLFYIYGLFDLFQNGCNTEIWTICEKDRYSPIFEKNSAIENIIKSVSYLFGFYVNMRKQGILEASSVILLLSFLIIFDFYIQKIQFYVFKKIFVNRKEYQDLKNKNIRLEAIISMGREKVKDNENIKKQIEIIGKEKPSNAFYSHIKNINERYESLLNKIKNTFQRKNLNINDEEEKRGKYYIIKFLESFRKAGTNEVSLKSSQNKYNIEKFVKKIFEEVIILLMICTSIAKINVWSFVYILISINLIISANNMKKYYYIFCFLIVAFFAQLILILSNLNKNTSPSPDRKMLYLISKTLHIPWYKGNIKYGFFYGFGASISQIYLICIDLLDIIVLYIYLEYFSYCIYEEADNIGQSRDINNKINYNNLKLNEKFYNCIKTMSDEKLNEYKECMKNNLDIKIEDLKEKLGIHSQEMQIIKSDTNDISLEVKDNIINTKEDRISHSSENENEDIITSQENQNENENGIANNAHKKLKWSFFFRNIIELVYLSFHNIILLIIILISMMVSGILSFFYIITSLYFLITSSRLYLGQKYYYLRAIKKVLRVVIIIDIAIQILYQMPAFSQSKEEKTVFDIILDIIGLNRIIIYGKNDKINYDEDDDIDVYMDQMLIIFCKAFTYFFMGIQILIYSSQHFQEHYLVYIVTRKIEIKRRSLIKAFRFNNKRIKSMNDSIKLREEIPLEMKQLKDILEIWDNKLSNMDSQTSHTNLISYKINQEKIESEKSLINKKKKEKIFEENKVKQYIKKLILKKPLVRLRIFVFKFSIDYSKINPDERDTFERDVIQGNTKGKTSIEKIIDSRVDNLQLGNFNELEMIELKKFFTKTEEQLKKMEEQKENKIKEKEKENEISFDFIEPELKQDIPIVDLTQPKFIEIENLLKGDLFQRYLQTSYLIKELLVDLMVFCSKKFILFCFILMILNHYLSASLISMVYPLSIFCYAIFEYPRPSKSYWNFCLIYSIIVLSLKYMVQLQFFVEIFGYKDTADGKGEKISVYKDFIKNLEYYKIGLKYTNSTYCKEFFKYIIPDAIVIVFLLINNLLLIIDGILDKREQEIENIYYAIDRVTKTKNLLPKDIDNLKEFNDYFLESDRKGGSLKINDNETIDLPFYNKFNETQKEDKKSDNENNDYITIDTYDEKNRSYFQRLFPKIRNEKPGSDFYASYTVVMILIIVYIIIFYTSMVKDVRYNAFSLEVNKINQFSGSMIIFLIIHILFLCYDRILYIRQNVHNIKRQYIIYDKSNNMKQVSEKTYQMIKKDIANKYDIDIEKNFFIPPDYLEILRKKYEIVNVQIENFNKILFQKYILHIIIVLFGHFFIYFYAPMAGNYNLNDYIFCFADDNECNNFEDNSTLAWFYILYLFYFIFSGMQIKYGFHDIKRKSILKKSYSSFNKNINAIFKALPFLYEIKLAIDWAFTPTSLDLFQWDKFENVYDTMYNTYCEMKEFNTYKVGQKIGNFMKFSLGGVFSFILIFILVLPILIFSSLNPLNELNNIYGADIKIDLSFKDSSGLIKNYNLFQSEKPIGLYNFEKNKKEFTNELKEYNYYKSSEIKNFPTNQIQKLNFSDISEKHWGMTKPHIQKLLDLLSFNETQESDNTTNIISINDIIEIQLIIDYQFKRYHPVEAKKPGERHGILLYDITNKTLNNTLELIKLRDSINNCTETEVTFKNFYSSLVRLTASADSREIIDEQFFNNLDIYLGFTGCKIIKKEENINSNNYTNIEKSYLESFFTFGVLGKHGKEGLFFYILSDKISSSTSDYSVITFYITFILLVGNYVRNFFADSSEQIMFTEMPDCFDIINLCEGIKIARNSFNFEQEENLYYILMELMRSPDYLKFLTKSSVDQFNKRKKLTEKSKDPNCFMDDEID